MDQANDKKNDAENRKLIDLVRERPSIWKKGHYLHKDKLARENDWRSVTRNFDQPGSILKNFNLFVSQVTFLFN